MFHCVYVSQLPYPFIYQWTSRLLSCPNYCEYCCNYDFFRVYSPAFLKSPISCLKSLLLYQPQSHSCLKSLMSHMNRPLSPFQPKHHLPPKMLSLLWSMLSEFTQTRTLPAAKQSLPFLDLVYQQLNEGLQLTAA